MPADIAQKRNVEKAVEPFGVVDHDRIAWLAAERQVVREAAPDARQVGVDLLRRKELARLVTARRVADLGRAAAHQGDRLVAGLLPPAQQHDLREMADME